MRSLREVISGSRGHEAESKVVRSRKVNRIDSIHGQLEQMCRSAGLVHRAYAGESERILREAFAEASSQVAAGRSAIIFIDEIDALCPHRDSRREQESRIVAQLLTLMDGSKASSGSLQRVVVVASTNRVNAIDPALRRPGRFDAEIEVSAPSEEERFHILQGVLVLGATNRPQAIDAALMRPGRFDLVLYVPPPDLEGRIEVLRVHTRNMKLANDVDLPEIAKQTQFFTGAELAGLCREAAIVALREDICADSVFNRHFELARNFLRPSLTELQIASYSSFMKKH